MVVVLSHFELMMCHVWNVLDDHDQYCSLEIVILKDLVLIIADIRKLVYSFNPENMDVQLTL